MTAALASFFQNDVKSFCLQIAEDDGEVDLDFLGIHEHTNLVKN